MVVGTLIIELHLPGTASLKEKRSIVKRLIARLHKQFTVSCGEVGLHDVWQSTTLGVAVVSTTAVHATHVLENVLGWIEYHRPDLVIVGHSMDTINFSL
jgi:uncharacterized protein YlxP (DUF503 family)